MKNIVAFIFCSLAIAMLAGCGSEVWQAATQPTTGSVSINGLPPSGALVQLHPVADAADKRKSLPWGKVQPDGTFTLTTYELHDGAPVGEYVATIVWPEDSSKPSFFDRLDHRYDQPEESQWHLQITDGENVLPPIEITNAKFIAKPKTNGRGKPSPLDVVTLK